MGSRRRFKIIANPVSGRGRAKRMVPRVVYELHQRGCTIDFALTERAGDARRFAGETSGYDALIVVGGDGTVNEVVNGLPPGAPPIGLIPMGTANVLAKELGLPWSVKGLADVLTDGRVVERDLGVIRGTGRKFALFVGAGFDSAIVERHLSRRRGPIYMWKYVSWGLETVVTYRPYRLRLETDGRVEEPRASWVEVAIGNAYGGPLVLIPHARPDDGRFDVMVSTSPYARDAARLVFAALWRYFTRTQYPMVDTRYVTATSVTLTSDERVPVQVDGDPGGELPVELDLVPRALRCLAMP